MFEIKKILKISIFLMIISPYSSCFALQTDKDKSDLNNPNFPFIEQEIIEKPIDKPEEYKPSLEPVTQKTTIETQKPTTPVKKDMVRKVPVKKLVTKPIIKNKIPKIIKAVNNNKKIKGINFTVPDNLNNDNMLLNAFFWKYEFWLFIFLIIYFVVVVKYFSKDISSLMIKMRNRFKNYA